MVSIEKEIDMTIKTINLLAPANKKDFIQLLDEAIRIADDLSAQLDTMDKILEEQRALAAA